MPAASAQSVVSPSTEKRNVTSPNTPTTKTGAITYEATSPGISENVKTDTPGTKIQSPTENCKGETNFCSNNNCMWRECEKPEFSNLAECEGKKANQARAGY
jgi:hypothetical protein